MIYLIHCKLLKHIVARTTQHCR